MNPRLKKTLASAGIFFVVYLAASFVIEVMVRHQPFSLEQALITAGISTISYAVVFYVVYSEHLIEHLEFTSGVQLLQEVYRVLKPQGFIRFSTPDLLRLTKLLDVQNEDTHLKYIHTINHLFSEADDLSDPTFPLNSVFYSHDHKFLYTQKLLERIYADVGFSDIKRFDPLVSDVKHLCGLEKHGMLLGDERLNTFECMVIQARKS